MSSHLPKENRGNGLSLIKAEAVTADVVAQYLRDNPDFFSDRQDLVETLSLPVREQGAVSLVEIQLQRQRKKIAQLEENIAELISLAEHNGQHFHQFMSLQEAVLKCDTFSQVIKVIEKFAHELSLKAYIKLIECDNKKHFISLENWKRFSTNHFNGKRAYLGRLKQSDREQLLAGDPCPELGSFVVLPLEKSSPLGIMAFASDDGGHFQPDMDTLFLHHLAVVVSHLISSLDCVNGEPFNVVTSASS